MEPATSNKLVFKPTNFLQKYGLPTARPSKKRSISVKKPYCVQCLAYFHRLRTTTHLRNRCWPTSMRNRSVIYHRNCSSIIKSLAMRPSDPTISTTSHPSTSYLKTCSEAVVSKESHSLRSHNWSKLVSQPFFISSNKLLWQLSTQWKLDIQPN